MESENISKTGALPMKRRHDREGSEGGYGLLSLLVAMPLTALLLASLSVVFSLGIKSYAYMLSDWEMQRQVQFAMEHLRYDLLYALQVKEKGGKLSILCRDTSAAPEWVRYELTEESRPRMMRNHQPVTGESMLGDILITQFSYRRQGERTVFFMIAAQNLLTDHTYALESAVTMPRDGDGT